MPHHDKDREGQQEHHGRGGAGKMLFAGVLGSIVGAAAAVLLSPWRGAEARQQLKERAKDVSAKVGSKAKEVASKAKEMLPQKDENED